MTYAGVDIRASPLFSSSAVITGMNSTAAFSSMKNGSAIAGISTLSVMLRSAVRLVDWRVGLAECAGPIRSTDARRARADVERGVLSQGRRRHRAHPRRRLRDDERRWKPS